MPRLPFVPVAFAATLSLPCAAQADDAATMLDHVRVQATRLPHVSAFETPASISVIDLDADNARLAGSLSETLGSVPGLAARDRQNHAQDMQLSIRGFGARSSFGVRGLRLYVDGIPATLPDGQGQLSHVSLATATRIEVLRGPFSALHGNSSGGVVLIDSAESEAPAQGQVQASLGRNASQMLSASLRDTHDDVGHAFAVSRFQTDGWREHGAAQRTVFNARLHVATPGSGRLQLVAHHFDAPDAQDPLGLTWQQVQDDPRQATAVAHQFDTRKSVRQDQLGLRLRQPLSDAHALEASAYAGRRRVEQFLAVPVAVQANPLHAGGMIDLDGHYGGLDLHWRWQGHLGGRTLTLVTGINADRQRQQRFGYENFLGGHLGVRGALRRDEINRVDSFDQYAQAWWQLAERWSLLAGARHSRVQFRADDHYVTVDNPDDSGRVDYGRTTPVAGLTFAPHGNARIYLSAGRGFETPTFNELGYRADGAAGLAFDLVPATSRNLELGTKWRNHAGAALEAALFRADTRNEIAVARSAGGRSSYRNIGRTRRQGAELSASLPLSSNWRLDVALTWLDARFRDSTPVCTDSSCLDTSTQIPAGNTIPGTARRQGYLRLQWQPGDWSLALETSARSRIHADDRNLASAPGVALVHVAAARDWFAATGSWRAFVRIDNLFDRRHVASVIVNDGNGRYFEPGPDRGITLGLRRQWRGRE